MFSKLSTKKLAMSFTLLIAATLVAAHTPNQSYASGTNNVTGVLFGEVYKYNTSSSKWMVGDTFGNTWSDDDHMYITICDEFHTWDGSSLSRNITFNRLPDDPKHQQGTLIDDWDYLGTASQTWADPDGETRVWKGGPIISVDGALYAMVDRQKYGSQEPDGRQTVYYGNIMKSTDKGQTWSNHLGQTNTAPPADSTAMFTNQKFIAPYFIEHGKDYSATSPTYKTDTYVYATSNYKWGNDDQMYLGRVPKDSIMDKTAWEYYKGTYPQSGSEGLNDANWSSDANDATPIFEDAGKVNYSDVKYIPGIQKYIMFGYYYPDGIAGSNSNRTFFKFHASDTPWGPWTTIATRENPNSGFYIPTAPSKWISEDGKNFKIIYAASWNTLSEPWDKNHYSMFVQEISLSTGNDPLPVSVNDDVTGTGLHQLHYTGNWASKTQPSAEQDDITYSNTSGDTLTMQFQGKQVVLRGSKAYDLGKFAVSIDNGPETIVDPYDPIRAELAPLYVSPVLSSGTHTVKVRLTGTKHASSSGYYVAIDRLDVYAEPYNLVTNFGFEANSEWTLSSGATRVRNNAHSGSFSLKTGSSSNGAYRTITGLQPSTTYTLQAFGKKDASLGTLVLFVKNYGGTEIQAPFTATSYKQQSITFTTGPNSTSAEIGTWSWGGSGNGYADSFMLRKN